MPAVPAGKDSTDTRRTDWNTSPGIGHHQTLDYGREARITRLCLGLTLTAWAVSMWDLSTTLALQLQARALFDVVSLLLLAVVLSGLIYGSVVYQLARLGYLQRRAHHVPVDAEQIERCFDADAAPALAILVPSYKEEVDVVRHTLLSAALQDYPHRRVVLLIDDPSNPATAEDAARLARMRALPQELERLLRPQATRFAAEYRAFLKHWNTRGIDRRAEGLRLTHLYREAASWFDAQAQNYTAADHAAALLIRLVFITSRDAHRRRAEELERATEAGELDEARILREYRRLNYLLRVELTSFERKRYVNLAHEANKAMNLNSYIALLGRSFREVERPDGLHLEPAAAGDASLHVPDADFLVTLDADSLIAPDYAARLIYPLQLPENARVAVTQTPYSAIPDAPGVLERIAGATTDIQYLLHQGFTTHHATFWVGANALLRVAALRDIATDSVERGFPIRKFIQDHTVIEDTESSVDFVAGGWRLHNYPERLAYSATPPDFGALLIQRRRWANGGLLILPKLLRYLTHARPSGVRLVEGFFRVHYLISIAAGNLGLLLLLAFPFGEASFFVWIPLAALPYFLLYGRDLMQAGYRRADLLRVYALNLLLIPVNLGGVFRSLQQAITGRKVPFGRTPKVASRTPAPALYVATAYVLLGQWLLGAGNDVWHERWMLAAFSLINAAFLAYAIRVFIGWEGSRTDLAAVLPAQRINQRNPSTSCMS